PIPASLVCAARLRLERNALTDIHGTAARTRHSDRGFFCLPVGASRPIRRGIHRARHALDEDTKTSPLSQALKANLDWSLVYRSPRAPDFTHLRLRLSSFADARYQRQTRTRNLNPVIALGPTPLGYSFSFVLRSYWTSPAPCFSERKICAGASQSYPGCRGVPVD
ncbi:hypothetical protein C8F01DRAFT_1177944, partial [Mycena amicta]